VEIYEVGEDQGRPYFAMELVEGGSLDQFLARQAQPAEIAARLLRTLALAVQHAHDQHVIHRDLKPANILLVSDGVVRGEWSEDTTHHAKLHQSPLTTHHSPLTPTISAFA